MKCDPTTRRSLLSRLKNLGDQKSWNDFYETYQALIHKMAVRRGLDYHEAEDVVQETVISIAEKMSNTVKPYEYNGNVTFKGFLRSITYYRIVDQFRKRPSERRAGDLAQDGAADIELIERFADPATEGEDPIWKAEWNGYLIKAALEKLKGRATTDDLRIFYLYVIRGQAPKMVAQNRSVPIEQVYQVKHWLSPMFKEAVRKIERNEP